MGGCQNDAPLSAPLSTRCRNLLRIQKGTIILTTTQICSFGGHLVLQLIVTGRVKQGTTKLTGTPCCSWCVLQEATKFGVTRIYLSIYLCMCVYIVHTYLYIHFTYIHTLPKGWFASAEVWRHRSQGQGSSTTPGMFHIRYQHYTWTWCMAPFGPSGTPKLLPCFGAKKCTDCQQNLLWAIWNPRVGYVTAAYTMPFPQGSSQKPWSHIPYPHIIQTRYMDYKPFQGPRNP